MDLDSTIVVSNHQFVRLCGEENSIRFGQRLAAIVAEPDRPALDEALQVLTTLKEYRANQRGRSLTVVKCHLKGGP